MGEIHHAVYGWVTPTISYFTACLGSLISLRSVRWALASEGRSRRNWLCFASLALGGGIWSMHFIAMLGFAVTGVEIRYDVPLTVLSLVVAVLVVGAGIFTVGYSRRHPWDALLIGGTATGLGVAAMHYLGMAAMSMPGDIRYDLGTVALSVGIAVFAATAALWAALNIDGTVAMLAAAPVMGVAVCAMHYTGMAAVSVHLHASGAGGTGQGVIALQLLFPLAVGLGGFVFCSCLAFAAAPSPQKTRQPVLIGPAPALPARRTPATSKSADGVSDIGR